MKSDDITVHVLTEIRDAIGTLTVRIDGTNARLDGTNARIDETNTRVGRLEDRVTEFDLRMSCELQAVNGTMRDVHALLKDRLDLRDRMDRAERDIEDLKKRVG